MGIHHRQVHQDIVFSGGHAPHALATPMLGLVGVARNPLDVSPLAEGYDHVLVGDALLNATQEEADELTITIKITTERENAETP